MSLPGDNRTSDLLKTSGLLKMSHPPQNAKPRSQLFHRKADVCHIRCPRCHRNDNTHYRLGISPVLSVLLIPEPRVIGPKTEHEMFLEVADLLHAASDPDRNTPTPL